MAYSTGAAATQDALMDALRTFALAQGWTSDAYAGNVLEIHKGTIYVQFQWDDTTRIQVFHSLGYDGSGPGSEPDDSGNGGAAERQVSGIGAGPFVKYHFFAPSSGEDYIHVVLEYAAAKYRHFTFGELVKVGTWTGGEYCFGHYWYASDPDDLRGNQHAIPFDGRSEQPYYAGTIHAEGLPSQAGAGKWGICWNLRYNSSPGTDKAGNPRTVFGSEVRNGFVTCAFAGMKANPSDGYVPLIPLAVYHSEDYTLSVKKLRLVGYAPDVRYMNMRNFAPAEEITIGGDTWMVFPVTRKRYVQDNAEESWNAAFAYKKIP